MTLLTQIDENKLATWYDKQTQNLKEKLQINIIFPELNIECDKTLIDNRDRIAEEIKTAVMKAQGILTIDNTTKKVKEKEREQTIKPVFFYQRHKTGFGRV